MKKTVSSRENYDTTFLINIWSFMFTTVLHFLNFELPFFLSCISDILFLNGQNEKKKISGHPANETKQCLRVSQRPKARCNPTQALFSLCVVSETNPAGSSNLSLFNHDLKDPVLMRTEFSDNVAHCKKHQTTANVK